MTVAVVAGGTGPIGKAVASRLAAAGFQVAVLARADLADVDSAITGIEQSLGPVGVLVNAAHPRLHTPAPVASIDPADLAAHLGAVQLHAALCARVVPGMRSAGWGRVVYLSGALMARPVAGRGAYGAAKAAASVLTRYLALEEGRHGITANIVAPGRVADPGEELSPEQEALAERLRETLALPDFPDPDDVADAVHTLVNLGALTGQTLWVTGGEPIHG
ncbi:SDR family NAD(P)-dependent oxidoreductase [Actinoplanes sp. RD1]|uniref:SDR family NAD(P)-dependent oxidoreductase n=1 Tax=Actinoplanes sp. RD1 TaxID=3064538 RepID=UPI00274109AE|nr:SDR family oxidoreductase [Actinoplanes sp. RD1]